MGSYHKSLPVLWKPRRKGRVKAIIKEKVVGCNSHYLWNGYERKAWTLQIEVWVLNSRWSSEN